MFFSEFIAKQEKIYEEFRDTSKIEANGLIPQISTNRGGYIIALRHSENIVAGIEEFTEKIGRVTSSIKYDKNNIHTTLSTYQVRDEFCPINENLESLTNIFRDNFSLFKGMEIEYNEWLINQDSGIVAGIPNRVFFENVRRISEHSQVKGIQLKFPWGAHITVSRFLKKISHEQTLQLIKIFKNSKPLGLSTPNYIDVGYFILTPGSFKINIYERFKV